MIHWRSPNSVAAKCAVCDKVVESWVESLVRTLIYRDKDGFRHGGYPDFFTLGKGGLSEGWVANNPPS